MRNEVNVIIAGVGGQGVLFATNVMVRTALKLGLNFAQSEVHGLSQRYGSIHTEIRIGKSVESPLILEGTLDLLISMELLEAMRYARYVSDRTTIVTNSYLVPSQAALLQGFNIPTSAMVMSLLKSLEPRRVVALGATEIAMEKVGDAIVTNSVMLGAASALKVLPFSSSDLRGTLGDLVPLGYKDMNLKAFDLGLEEANRLL